MIQEGADALDHALELIASPELLLRFQQDPLPDTVLLLIRIAAGDKEALSGAERRTSATALSLGSAAVRYLRQVLFVDDANPYRLLGVRDDAGDKVIKEHYRWLMHWLHPDRDPQGDTQVMAQRVNRAWQQIRSADRRQQVATNRRPVRSAQRVVPASTLRCGPPSPQAWPRDSLSPEALRWLPSLVLASLAILMVTGLFAWNWFYAGPMTSSDADSRTANSSLADPAIPAGNRSLANPVIANPVTPSPEVAAAETTDGTTAVAEKHDADVDPNAATPASSTSPSLVDSPELVQGAPSTAFASSDPVGETVEGHGYADVPVRFSSAYAQGDLAHMMELFTPDAVDASGRTHVLADEYQHLFRSSRWRRMRLYDWSWNVQNLRAVGNGAYEAWIARHGDERALHLQGLIEIEVVPVADAWKIRRIVLQETHP